MVYRGGKQKFDGTLRMRLVLEHQVTAVCRSCGHKKEIDLVRLANFHGPDYVLTERKLKCTHCQSRNVAMEVFRPFAER